MSGYERVGSKKPSSCQTETNQQVRADDDAPAAPALDVPNSPPPSFHSRASSRSSSWDQRNRRQPLNPTLADAFADPDAPAGHSDDASDDDDDNNDDDRQRLIRQRDALRPLRAPPSAAAVNANSNSSSSGSSGRTGTAATAATATTPASSSTPAPTTSGRVYGGGIQSDGVFSNLTARPEPGEEKEEQPPAAADAVPPYWETTILAPGLGGPDDVFVDGMPVGSLFSFVWNGMISMSFQFVGFLLTYLLHSTHAAKNGSRAGLGITLIQYGFYMKGLGADDAGGSAMTAAGSAAAAGGSGGGGGGYASPPDPNAHDFDPGNVGKGADGDDGGGGVGGSLAEIASSEWVAYTLMIVGWLILFRAVHDYLRARRHEQLVLQSPDRGLGVAVIGEGEIPERVV